MSPSPPDRDDDLTSLTARPRDPEERPSEIAERPLQRWSLAASAGFHAAVLLALILVAWLGFSAPPEEEAVKVTLLNEGPGAAGASGGAHGGGGQEQDASSAPAAESAAPAPPLAAETSAAPPAPTTEVEDKPSKDEPVPQQAATFAPMPAAAPPPPRRKPTPSRPHLAGSPRLPQPSEAPPTPSSEPAQIAAAPLAVPTPGAPGTGGGPGGTAGLGTGAEGLGHGAIGDGPIEGPGDDYLDRLRRWLNRYKHYPEDAQERKQEGQLVVSFTILRDGTVREPRIERSSGFPLLDRAALEMLRDASPVPPLPEAYKAQRLAVDLPVEFSIGFFQRMF